MTVSGVQPKVAIVTGAASGLGRAIAQMLAAEGAIVIVSDLDAAAVEEARAEIEETAGLVSGRVMDVTDHGRVREVVDSVHEEFGSVDILVNSAGIRFISPFLEQRAEEWQATIDVNLHGVFNCSQAAARHMVTQRWGRIINIASTTGILALTKRSSYAASKAGVIGLTKAMAFELSSTGITTNAIAPGPIETPMNAPYFEDETMTAILRKEIPRGTWGQPSDVANAVLYLAGEGAGHVSGAVLSVDGGWLSGKGY